MESVLERWDWVVLGIYFLALIAVAVWVVLQKNKNNLKKGPRRPPVLQAIIEYFANHQQHESQKTTKTSWRESCLFEVPDRNMVSEKEIKNEVF